MSFQPDFEHSSVPGVRVAYPTEAKPVYDPTEFIRLVDRDYADSESALDLFFGQMRDQYQARDWRSHDYDLSIIRGVSYPVRGPVPDHLEHGNYFVVLGSAASFGARAHRPYAHRLSEAIGMPCLNLSKSGIGPEWLNARYKSDYAEWVQGAAFVIVEATSARSVSNSAYQLLPDGTKARRRGAQGSEVLKINREIKDMYATGRAEDAAALISESLANYEDLTKRLLAKIPCPKVLLYFSRRDPGEVGRRNLHRKPRRKVLRFLSSHPHYVDRTALRRIGKSVEVVECVTDSGLPSRAKNRFNGTSETWRRIDPAGNIKGEPLDTQNYYPSDEMHADACEALLRTHVIQKFHTTRYEQSG